MTGEQRLGAGRELGSLESNISDDEIKSIIQTDLYSCYYCCIIQGIILIQNAERIKKISTIQRWRSFIFKVGQEIDLLWHEPHFTLRLSKIDCKERL